MSVVALLALMATHAIVTIAAAVFGYLVVIALRETLAAVLGPRWFTRVSPWAQGALIVVLGGSLLLLPPAADRIGAARLRWLAGDVAADVVSRRVRDDGRRPHRRFAARAR